jgi:ParB family chromosome partitioning protein
MSTPVDGKSVRIIPIARIVVLNTRDRASDVFSEIVASIKSVGLKKPITVTSHIGSDGIESFKLVCGEGRMKALQELGESQVPAIVIEATDEDAYIMSLVENLARRRYRPIELLTGIRLLHAKGYNQSEIARKTGLSHEYVRDILMLANKGEERLLTAVEIGALPLRVACDIVEAGDNDVALQATLHSMYESGVLRGSQLLELRKVLKRRAMLGKTCSNRGTKVRPPVTARSLVRTYQQEVERQRLFVRKGVMVQERLLVVVSAVRRLLADENFVTLLRAEGLVTLPKYLADKASTAGGGAR